MSIKLKLTIIFLAVALIPTLLIVAISFQNYRNSLEAEHLASLQHLTIYKADRIESYFSGLKDHMKISQGFYNIKKNLPVMIHLVNEPNNPEFVAAQKTLSEQLKQMQSVSDLSDIMLLTPEGKVIYTNRVRHKLKDMSNGIDAEQKAFSEGKNRIYFSDVYFDKTEDNRFEMLLTGPAFDFDNTFIGVIAFEINMTAVYNLIQDTTGLGHTGEVLAVKKIGNSVEFLNPLRHDPDAPLKRKITLGEASAYPAQQAVLGKTGTGIATDYRGKKVIAAWRYIPSLDWGLVAKIDIVEAFADVANLQKLVTIVLVLIFILAGLMAFSIARSIAEPVKRLAEGAGIIGSGNLDYKVGSDSKDEIGQLSRSFDKMTHDLRTTTASRDELNKEIIERKHAETALRESEERFRTMANAMQQLAWIARADGHIFWYNQRWYDYTGTTAEQMEGWGWQSVHDPVLLPKVMEQWKASLDQGTSFEMEFPLRRADGQFRQFLTRGVPLKDSQGRVVQWFGTNTDIHDIKQAEQALRENEARLSLALNVSQLGLWELDLVNHNAWRSPRHDQIFGYDNPLPEWTYEMFLEHVLPEDRENVDRLFKEAVAAGRDWQFECRIRRPNGQICWISARGCTYFDANGKPVSMLGLVGDITQRKQADAERELTVEFLRIVNESTATNDLIEKVTTFFQKQTGCEAIGIRLKEGDDYPYYEARGFSKEFVLAENSLCTMDSTGQILRDSEGYPIHECMCGNIINGRFDPSKPFFTKHGSFWTNCTTELLATTTEKDRQSRTRNRCNGQGYESVALIPLRFGDQRLGLLQLNDKRKGQFSLETIQLWERLADQLATAVAKFRAEEALRQSHERMKKVLEVETVGVMFWDLNTGCMVDANDSFLKLMGYSRSEVEARELTWQKLTPPEYIEVSRAEVKKFMATGRVGPYEKEYFHKDGTRQWLLFAGSSLGNNQCVEFCVDISDRKAAEEALQKAHDELEHRVKERTAELAHTVETLEQEVRQRQLAEENIRKQASLLDLAHDAILVRDLEGKVTFWSEGAAETYGFMKEQAIGKVSHNLLKTQFPTPLEKIEAEVVHKGRWEGELIHTRSDGVKITVASRWALQKDNDGKPSAIMEINSDITESKRMQDELQESAIYSRNLLEASLDPLVTINSRGQITDVNEATERTTGLSREVLIGNDFSDYFTDPQKAREGYQQVFAKGFITDYPLTIRSENGTLIDVLYNATVFKNEAGEIQGVFAAARDVTERKAAEEKQKVTNSMLELFAKKTSRNDYLADTVNVIRNWSGCEFIGIRIRDDKGNIPYESHSDFDSNFLALEGTLNLEHDHCICIRTMLQRPLAGEKNCTTTAGSFYSNDSHAFLQGLSKEQLASYRGNCMKWGFQSIAVIPIRYHDEILGVIHVADPRKDMVELAKVQFIEATIAPLIGEAIQRFNAEAELEKYRLHLEELVAKRTTELEKEVVHRKQVADDLTRSNNDLEQFAYVASHDLQEPLRAVAGFVGLLKHQLGDSLDAKKLEYMAFAIDGVARMQSLINGLLEYSRIGSRGRKLESTNVKMAFDRAMAHLQMSIKETGAQIIADDLPTVNVDAVQLVQLFQNLLGNALKFRSSEAPRIHVSATHTDNRWQFAVTDNGIGIEPQYADRIFLIFQRLHTRDKYPGTGIGLSLCKKIIERHHGKIWVESKLGAGSTFYFTIPDTGKTS